MKEEYRDENGREPWKEPDNWRNLMNRLSHDELLSFLRHLDAAIESDPGDAPSLTARGMLHVKLGDDRRAAADFGRVIDLEPGNAKDPGPRGSGGLLGRRGGLRRRHPFGPMDRRRESQPGSVHRGVGRPGQGNGGL